IIVNGIRTFLLPGLVLLAAFWTPLAAAMSVSLSPSAASPAPLGTLITWNVAVSNAGAGTLWYRFRARSAGNDFHTIVDYVPRSWLTWSTIDAEGPYEIEVSVRNNSTGETAQASAPFVFTSLITGSAPAVTTTVHPLVFIYSAPSCAHGNWIRMQFASP